MGYSLPRRFENEPQLRPGKPFPFPISTYLPGMSKICTPTNDEPCYFYHFIECLPRGVKSCAKLWTSVDGMGTGNQGGVNWGNNNTGIKNRGEWCGQGHDENHARLHLSEPCPSPLMCREWEQRQL